MAEDLLAGPRGRGLCLAVAAALDDQIAFVGHARGRQGADHLVRMLEELDPAPVAGWWDPLAFLTPMGMTVSHAMYWQEPLPEDLLAADSAVIAALRPLAGAVVNSPGAGWWSTPVDLAALRYTCRFDQRDPVAFPAVTGARHRLARWRADVIAEERQAATDRPADPRASISGSWWSTPAPAELVTTTRPLPGLGSVELAWEEDSFEQDKAAIWPLAAARTPRIWEIDRPQEWTQLVGRYPLDVTHARRHDWYRTTGRAGPWWIPDWRQSPPTGTPCTCPSPAT